MGIPTVGETAGAGEMFSGRGSRRRPSGAYWQEHSLISARELYNRDITIIILPRLFSEISVYNGTICLFIVDSD